MCNGPYNKQNTVETHKTVPIHVTNGQYQNYESIFFFRIYINRIFKDGFESRVN